MAFRARWSDYRLEAWGSIFWSQFGNTAWNHHHLGEFVGCEDYVGNFDGDNPFLINRGVQATPTISGTYALPEPSTEYIRFTEYPPTVCSTWPGSQPTAYYPDPNTADVNEAAWEILAESNPSVADINVPQAIGELKDLPSLVKGYGDTLLQSAATAYLSWRWCIKPMISDFQKLWNFAETATKQLAMLKKLKEGHVMRRTVQLLSDDHSAETPNTYINTQGVWVMGTKVEKFTRKRWGTVQWGLDPDSPVFDMDEMELIRFNRALLTGINSYGALAATWELLPWSWLVDWFSNVGDMINATNNQIGMTATRMCLMQTTTSQTSFKEVDDLPDGLSWTGTSGSFDVNWQWTRK